MGQEAKAVAYLKALTLESQAAIHGKQFAITEIPFRVGRESRGPNEGWVRSPQDRREGRSAPNNDLYIWEQSREVFVSREHFQIEKRNGSLWLVDRKSTLGTWVEGQLVGGKKAGGAVELYDNDVIILGSHQSGFIFKFLLA
jgi:pSer/pThr/pTyr-binding forkhead associated (FHA) protein